MNVFDVLKDRGLIEQMTDEDAIRDLLGREKVTFYIGFDATADSLHVGHYVQLSIMRRLQQAGHIPIVLMGGGTTMIGDPTGKTDLRKMITLEQINENIRCFKQQVSKFIDFSDGMGMLLNNADWLMPLNYIEFLRDIGVHFSVNRMLTMEAFKTRLERGLSFIEFNYTLLQSYDFYHLFGAQNCKLQLGGNDQWSNIIGGVELIRRKLGEEAYGLTFALLTNKDGVKMGKTEKGAVWLDPEKTTPYDFFQYWRNVEDESVCNCLRILTDVPMDQIRAFEQQEGQALNAAKQLLAVELTSTVHSPEEAQKALDASLALFSGGSDRTNMPTMQLDAAVFTDGGIEIQDLLIRCGLTASRGEGRRLIEQGGIFLDEEKVSELFLVVPRARFEGDGLILRKGKKVFVRAQLS